MQEMKQIEIPLSKKKMLAMLFGGLLFLAMGIWFIGAPFNSGEDLWGPYTWTNLFGYLCVLCGGVIAILGIPKFFDKRPGMVIDNQGLTDNSSFLSIGRVLWKDIEEVNVLEINRQKLIMFKVHNPQQYIEQQTNKITKKALALNNKWYGAPLAINSATLKISHDDLWKIIMEKLNAKHPRA